MAVIVGSARIDENGAAHGGAAGDQTGREVSTQNWYESSKGWVLLRAKHAEAREKIARCMQAACDNKHIGYDQYQRDTLYNAAKEYGFDAGKVTKNVETDCSALVRVCVCYAGISVPSFRTTSQAGVLVATGAFDKFTDDLHCKKSSNLLRGDILVTRTQGHTVVVLSNGSKAFEEVDIALGSRKLEKGSAGTDVRELQQHLMKLGYKLPKYSADGEFGSETAAALTAFQKTVGIRADGVYDAEAHEALMAAASGAPGEQPAVSPSEQPNTVGKQVTIVCNSGPVNIRKGNGMQYGIITKAKQGATYAYVSTAANG